jgi:hypothetical protein
MYVTNNASFSECRTYRYSLWRSWMQFLPAADNYSVDHPKHYNAHPSGIECIEVVRHMSFNIGNAMKYLWRADEKGAPIEDLEKAERNGRI